MENQLWSLFRETGEPMGYLLYRVDHRNKPGKQAPRRKKKDGAAPSF